MSTIKKITIGAVTLSLVGVVSWLAAEFEKNDKEWAVMQKRTADGHVLLTKAKAMAESGRFEEALDLYRKATGPDYINYEYNKGQSILPIVRILKHLHRYEEALAEHRWYLRHPKPSQRALEAEAEIRALMHYRDTGDKSKVLEHIENLKLAYPDDLPSDNRYGTNTLLADLWRLYDVIGEYENGIALVDERLDAIYSQNTHLERVLTTEEAARRAVKWTDGVFNKEARSYEIIKEHLKVREAFEQDKRDGTKGRATRAIIESKYFPW